MPRKKSAYHKARDIRILTYSKQGYSDAWIGKKEGISRQRVNVIRKGLEAAFKSAPQS